MEIKVLGSSLDQWELGRKIRITPPDGIRIDRAEFCHAGDNETLPVQPYYDDGILVADIPNLFLQSGEPIHAFLVHIEENALETVASCILSVSKRPKPNEYVYTETEVMSWQALDARMREFMAAVTSAYDIAVKYGYEGTEEEWIAELQGNAAESARLASEAQAKAAEAQWKAEQAQTGAEQSATNAANSEKKAADSEANAKTSEQNASASATNAGNSEQNAVAAAYSAGEAAMQAELSSQGAAQFASNAAQSAQNAAGSASNAAASESTTIRYAKNAKTAEDNATAAWHFAEDEAEIATSAKNAAEKAKNDAQAYVDTVVQSASNAKASENNAKASENNAKASETNAAKSAEEAKKAATSAGGIKTVNGVSPDESGNVQVETSSQSDWNAPEGEPGHVLNRTHWVDESTETVLETSVPVFNSLGGISTPFELIAGKTYTVHWDNAEYSGKATSLTGEGVTAQVIDIPGIVKIIAFPPDMLPNTYGQVDSYDDGLQGTFDLAIYRHIEEVHKLDPKFLPDGVPYSEGGFSELPVIGQWLNDGFMVTDPIGLKIGETYVVNWDGVEYTVVGLDLAPFFAGTEMAVLRGVGAWQRSSFGWRRYGRAICNDGTRT